MARLLAGFEPVPPAPDDCGVRNWSDLHQRMHYIVHLLCAFHQREELSSLPFTREQMTSFRTRHRCRTALTTRRNSWLLEVSSGFSTAPRCLSHERASARSCSGWSWFGRRSRSAVGGIAEVGCSSSFLDVRSAMGRQVLLAGDGRPAVSSAVRIALARIRPLTAEPQRSFCRPRRGTRCPTPR